MKYSLIISFLFLSVVGFGQNNILTYIDMLDKDISRFNEADISPNDTIIDIKNGYYELAYNDEHYPVSLVQAAIFKNNDNTILLAIKGYYADMQCSNHTLHFYEYDPISDSLTIVTNVLRDTDWGIFFRGSSVAVVIEKYLPEIQEDYLDSTATVETVLDEVYDLHVTLPRYGTTAIATLTVCDYIPTNAVNIEIKDWDVIEDSFHSIELTYNKETKQFEFDESPTPIERK